MEGVPASSTPTRRILCIDGGGIMGTQPAAFLAALEEDLGHPIGECFDLIAGTSTGGILALGLGLGMTAKELLELYVDRGPTIFGGADGLRGRLDGFLRGGRHLFGPKHKAELLRDELQRVLRGKRIGHASTRLVIPAWDPHHRSVYIFKTAHHPRLKTDYKRFAVDAAMATAAAPTIFRQHRMPDSTGLLDGGVWGNNPIAVAVVEAIGLLRWPRESLRILSLGCVNEVYSLPESLGIATIWPDLTRLFLVGQSHGALGMAKLLTGHEYEREAIFRVCPDVPAGLFTLDDTRKIAQLRGMGASAARRERPRIEPVFLHSRAEPFVPIYSLSEENLDARAH
jgi:hypothetical protein